MPTAKGLGPVRHKTSDAKYRVKEIPDDSSYGVKRQVYRRAMNRPDLMSVKTPSEANNNRSMV